MLQLQEIDKKIDNVDTALKGLNKDFNGFVFFEAINTPVEILREVFKDEENWLSYFIWECNWLENDFKDSIEINDKPVKIDDWGDAYDFLRETAQLKGVNV